MARTVLPLSDLVDLDLASVRADGPAALAVAAMSLAQGLAWAWVAGLPPALGLWAGTFPTIVAALSRSSRTTVIGPTNALAVLVATSLGGADDPAAAAAALALFVGAAQLVIGAASLHRLADLVPGAVVTGLVTGAATAMGAAQLPYATGQDPAPGPLLVRLAGWVVGVSRADPSSVGLAVLTVGGVLVLRRRLPRGLPLLLAGVGGTLVAAALRLPVRTLPLQAVPVAWPPFGLPALGAALPLLPVAVAATVLSLVETAAIDRAGAERTGQHGDPRWDVAGLGAANVAAGLFGTLPVSGSLARSALVVQLGARTRLAPVGAALLVLAALPLVGRGVGWVPLPVLAGVVAVAAADLVDPARLRAWWASGPGDRAALAIPLVASWLLPFSQAVGLGLAVAVVLFVRRARLLLLRELWPEPDGRLREIDPEHAPAEVPGVGPCAAVAVVSIEGPLFFGSAGELDDLVAPYVDDEAVRVLVLRLRRASGLDLTAARALRHLHELLARRGRHLLLVGAPPGPLQDTEDAEVTRELGPTGVDSHLVWLRDLDAAVARARGLAGPPSDHGCGDRCPLARAAGIPSPP